MAGFTKLFNSILDSTIWQEPNETRLLWITMLAMSDARGEVQASIPGLARRAGITIDECEAGLVTLTEPDRYSRTTDHEGRRIAKIDGGWRLLNHGRYRELLSTEERREYNRKKQAEWRATRQTIVNDMSITVNHNKQCQHISEAEAEADTTTTTPRLDEVDVDAYSQMPTGNIPSMLSREKRIQSLKKDWKLPFTYAEQQVLMQNAACLDGIDNTEWQIIKDWLFAKLPQGDPTTQPRSRIKFLEWLPDVYRNAMAWSRKNQKQTPTAPRQTPARTILTREQQEQMLKS